MPAKKSSTKPQPVAQRHPRTRKKAAPEPQPEATEPQPIPPAHSPWLAPVVIVLAVSLLGWLVMANQPPLYMVAAEQRLAQLEAMLHARGEAGVNPEANPASAQKRARVCHEGLQSMVRLWNRYVRQLKAARSGSPAKFNAARRRFEAAQKQASSLVRRCEAA